MLFLGEGPGPSSLPLGLNPLSRVMPGTTRPSMELMPWPPLTLQALSNRSPELLGPNNPPPLHMPLLPLESQAEMSMAWWQAHTDPYSCREPSLDLLSLPNASRGTQESLSTRLSPRRPSSWSATAFLPATPIR